MTATVIVFPVLLTLVMTVVQFALHFHAQQVVGAAAEDAVAVARLDGGSADAGRAAAHAVLDDVAPRLVLAPRVDVSASAGRVRATVRGEVASLVPFLRLSVLAVDEAPVERFTPTGP